MRSWMRWARSPGSVPETGGSGLPVWSEPARVPIVPAPAPSHPPWSILRLVLHEPKTYPITRTPIAARSEKKRDSISPLGGSKTGVNQGSYAPPSARGSPFSAARRRRPIRAPRPRSSSRRGPRTRSPRSPSGARAGISLAGRLRYRARQPDNEVAEQFGADADQLSEDQGDDLSLHDCTRDLRQPEEPCERGKRGWDASARRGKSERELESGDDIGDRVRHHRRRQDCC
jgi:hypothetical protein